MPCEPLRFSSHLSASTADVWASISTMPGVNYELLPLLRMTHPKAAAWTPLEEAPLGRCAFASYLLLLGVLPFDRHALTLVRVDRGQGFVEDSTSLLQRRWRHERRIAARADGGCVLTDELLFVPRLGLLTPLVRRIVEAIFRHRHRRLLRRFGGQRLP